MWKPLLLASAIALIPAFGAGVDAAATPPSSTAGASFTGTVNIEPASIVRFGTTGISIQANYGWPWIAVLRVPGVNAQTVTLHPGFNPLPQISGETISVSPSY